MNSTPYSQSNLERQRLQLEALVQTPSGRLNPLKTWGRIVIHALTAHRSPRIRQRMVQGQLQWVAYDPITQRTRYFLTEQDVRIWLESRYYE
jgi:hypothetical protein